MITPMRLPIILALLALPLASFGIPLDSDITQVADESQAPDEETRVVTLDITGMT